jgi:hypothetical protein
MGLYQTVSSDTLPDAISRVALAKSYTLYSRGGLWYVNFVADGRQSRLSTGLRDFAEARALVEELRRRWTPQAGVEVNAKHLARMIERARYKHRSKGVPFGLTMAHLREVAARCGGFCEVTGHRLEDSGPFRPSLDRITPSVGYVPGNVRIVCLITNTAMLHYGEAAFGELAIAYCRRIGVVSEPTQAPGLPSSTRPL